MPSSIGIGGAAHRARRIPTSCPVGAQNNSRHRQMNLFPSASMSSQTRCARSLSPVIVGGFLSFSSHGCKCPLSSSRSDALTCRSRSRTRHLAQALCGDLPPLKALLWRVRFEHKRQIQVKRAPRRIPVHTRIDQGAAIVRGAQHLCRTALHVPSRRARVQDHAIRRCHGG